MGVAKFFIDSLGPAEDLGDNFTGPGEEDAGGVDHRGECLQLAVLGVDGPERNRPGDRGAQPVPAAGDGDRRPFLDRE